MTNEEILELISLCSYKPGWTIHFAIENKGEPGERAYAQIGVDATTEASIDAARKDGRREPWKGGKKYFSQYMCRQEIVGAVYGMIHDAEIHEMREWFRFMGASIYNPHLDPLALVEVARKKTSFNVRENAMLPQ
jgi:hypothetical protein